MKKLIPMIAGAMLALLIFAGCGGGTELTISIGNGSVPDDGVSVKLVYGDTWKSGEKVFDVNYGHESEAVLADEYFVSLSAEDPWFEESVVLNSIFSFKKADLEERTVSGGKFSGKAVSITIDDLSSVLPQGNETCTAYIVLHSTATDFSDITTFSSHEITFEWQGEDVKIIN